MKGGKGAIDWWEGEESGCAGPQGTFWVGLRGFWRVLDPFGWHAPVGEEGSTELASEMRREMTGRRSRLAWCCLVLGNLVAVARAFKCAVQKAVKEEDWTEVDCNTTCLIAFGDSTLYPNFRQDASICQGAGCAVLQEGSSEVDLDASLVGKNDWPMNGLIEVFACTDATFSSNPESLAAEAGEACNLYSDFQNAEQCQNLFSFKVGELTRKAPFGERNKFAFIIGAACLFSIILLAFLVIRLRKRQQAARNHPVLKEGNIGGSVVGNRIGPAESFGSADPFPDRDIEDLEASAGVNSFNLDSSAPPPDPGEIPPQYAPGSLIYEKFHKALSSVYQKHGQDTSNVDAVLHQYLSKENGVQLLLEKLRVKFGVTVKLPRKPKRDVLNYD